MGGVYSLGPRGNTFDTPPTQSMTETTLTSFGISFRFWIPVMTAVLVAVAYIAYHRTTPEVPGRLRWLLVGLRTGAFLLLMIVLLDPRYVRTVAHDEPAKVVAAVDRSASMALPVSGWDAGEADSRFATALDLERRLEREVRRAGGEYERVYFSKELLAAPGDTVDADGQGTDIITTMEQIRRRNEGEHLVGVVLFSDGVETEERIVRRAAPDVPVFAVGLGDTAAPEDVRIRDVDYNPIVRVPSQTSIRADLSYTGQREKRVRLELREGNRVVFAKDTVMTPAAPELTQEIPVRFVEEGRRAFDLSVEVVGRDIEPENNRREIVIEAEKAQAKIVIVDMHPEWELHFLTEFLKRDQTFDFDLVTRANRQPPELGRLKKPDEFVASLEDCDAVVLVSVTEDMFDASAVAAVKRFVRDRGGGLLILPGTSSLFERPAIWRRFDELLPVQGTPPFRFNLQYTSVLPGAQAGANPITAHLLPIFSQTEWQERSPLLGYYAAVSAKSVSDVLLSVKGRSLPAVTYQTVGKGRVAAVSAGPLWRWKFLSENNAVYDEMISRMLDVLSRGEETDRFVLVAKKNVFDAGESPVLFAELFNEKMQPITGAPMQLEVARVEADGEETPLDLVAMTRESAENTRFKASLTPLQPGHYIVRGVAELPDRTINSQPVAVQISSTSVEFQRVNQDRRNLSTMARRSGGAYAVPADFTNLAAGLPIADRTVQSISELTLRTSLILFILILLLLSVEWLLRKRAGMI